MKTTNEYKVSCDAIEEVATVTIDKHSPMPEYEAALEASEYFWSLTKGEIGEKFDLRVYDMRTHESINVSVVVQMEPHFVIVA